MSTRATLTPRTLSVTPRARSPRSVVLGLLAALVGLFGLTLTTALPAHALPPDGAGASTPGTSSTVTSRLAPGDTLRFTVRGFPAGETVYVKIDDGQGYSDQTVQGGGVVYAQKISSGGTVSGSFELPSFVKTGSHWLRFLASEEFTDAQGNTGVNGFTNHSPTFTVVKASSGGSAGGTSSGGSAGTKSSDQGSSKGSSSDGGGTGTTGGSGTGGSSSSGSSGSSGGTSGGTSGGSGSSGSADGSGTTGGTSGGTAASTGDDTSAGVPAAGEGSVATARPQATATATPTASALAETSAAGDAVPATSPETAAAALGTADGAGSGGSGSSVPVLGLSVLAVAVLAAAAGIWFALRPRRPRAGGATVS